MIEVVDLKKTYMPGGVEVPALAGISFSIKEGEFVAVMGASGAGETTPLPIMSYLDRPTAGTYTFLRKGIYELSDEKMAPARNEKMGFVFQAFYLLPRSTVLDNVMLPLIYSRVPKNKRMRAAEKAIEDVGLSHRAGHLSTQLSGGEKQRVAIARAIVVDPSVIFADEPTGNLDSRSGLAIMHILQDLNEAGHTIILVTHETYTAEHAKRIIRLKDGLLVSDEIVKNRRHAEDEKELLK
jgi:putative ABC transport system ATP-binding protein